MRMSISILYSNTSHVIVKQFLIKGLAVTEKHSNTSHVIVKHAGYHHGGAVA